MALDLTVPVWTIFLSFAVLLEPGKLNKLPMLVAFVDLKKAFNGVDRASCGTGCHYGIGEKF